MNPVKIFLTEASLGCLMAVLPTADAVPILDWTHEVIRPEDLTGDGYENSPHVTILYGLHASVTPIAVQQALKGCGACRFTLGPVARFDTSKEHDVLYASVAFDTDLRALNSRMVASFGDELTQTFPDYRPHLCLAYVKKGAAAHLDGHCKLQGNTYSLQSLVFSLPESTSKHVIDLVEP